MQRQSFVLEKYGGRHTRYKCPGCGIDHQFTRYINTLTGEHLNPRVGRCNREHKCGYHYAPQQYFSGSKSVSASARHDLRSHRAEIYSNRPPSFIPDEIFRQSLNYTTENSLIKKLSELYGEEKTRALVIKYFIGTSSYWKGSTIFWQLDTKGRVRSGKVIDYDSKTLKRIQGRVNWVHQINHLENFHLKQCFFGEHLLHVEPKREIAIVESEKTAIIASHWLPEYIWLATGGLSNLTTERFKPLKGRNITLYPDAGGYEKWKLKACEMSPLANIKISRLLEDTCTTMQKKEGLDIADFLLGGVVL